MMLSPIALGNGNDGRFHVETTETSVEQVVAEHVLTILLPMSLTKHTQPTLTQSH